MFISVSSLLILRNRDRPCTPFSAQLSLPWSGLLLRYFSPPTSCNLHPVISNTSFVSSLCYRFPICGPSFCSRQRNPSHPCLISLDLFTFHLVCLLHQSKGPCLLLLKMLSWLAARIPLFFPPCWLSRVQPDNSLYCSKYTLRVYYVPSPGCVASKQDISKVLQN